MEARITEKLLEGNYITVQDKPRIVSAFGSVWKSNGDIRIILDCSKPKLLGLNYYATIDHVKYQSVQDALESIGPHWYQCKVDLQSVYRVECVASTPLIKLFVVLSGASWKTSNILIW